MIWRTVWTHHEKSLQEGNVAFSKINLHSNNNMHSPNKTGWKFQSILVNTKRLQQYDNITILSVNVKKWSIEPLNNEKILTTWWNCVSIRGVSNHVTSAQFSSFVAQIEFIFERTMKGYECTSSSVVLINDWIWCNLLTIYIIITKVCHAGWFIWLMSVTNNKTYFVYILYQMIKHLFYWTETELNWAIWNTSTALFRLTFNIENIDLLELVQLAHTLEPGLLVNLHHLKY